MSRRLNILYVTSGSENVGTYFRAFGWASELVKKGHNVTLVCAFETPNYTLHHTKEIQGVKIINLIKTPIKWDYPGFIIRSMIVFFLTLFNKWDIIHSFVSWQPPSLASLIAGKIKRFFLVKNRLYADWDDLWGDNGIGMEHGLILSKMITFLEKLIPRLTDNVTVCSSFLEEKAIKAGIDQSQITIIYNGVDTNINRPLNKIICRKKLNISTNSHIFFYMGQFHTAVFNKLISTFSEIYNIDQNAYLYFAGTLPDVYKQNIKFQNNIKTLGKIPHKKLSEYMSMADGILFVMDNTDTEKARFPVRFAEYMASGVPVLASPQGEVKKIIIDNNLCQISDINDYKKFARDALNMIKNKYSCVKAKKSVLFAQNFLSWDKISNQLLKVYCSNLNTVLIVSPFFSPNIGGVETHLDDLVNELNNKDISSIFSTYSPLTTKINYLKREQRGLCAIFRFPWFGHNWFHVAEKIPPLAFIYLFPGLFIQTLILLIKYNDSIKTIHAHGLVAAFIVKICNYFFKKKIIVSTHAIYTLSNKKLMSMFFIWILNSFDVILTLSEKSKSEFQQAGLTNINIVNYTYWVDQNRFKPGDKSYLRQKYDWNHKFIFLFVGRLITIKGVKVFIDIAKHYYDNKNFLFLVIGSGPEENIVQSASHDYSNIKFIKNVPNNSIDEYYKMADYLILPSQYSEGMARVVMEAMSSGIYILGSSYGCLPEMITNSEVGKLCIPTVDNFVQIINNKIKRKIDTNYLTNYAKKRFSVNNSNVIIKNY